MSYFERYKGLTENGEEFYTHSFYKSSKPDSLAEWRMLNFVEILRMYARARMFDDLPRAHQWWLVQYDNKEVDVTDAAKLIDIFHANNRQESK